MDNPSTKQDIEAMDSGSGDHLEEQNGDTNPGNEDMGAGSNDDESKDNNIHEEEDNNIHDEEDNNSHGEEDNNTHDERDDQTEIKEEIPDELLKNTKETCFECHELGRCQNQNSSEEDTEEEDEIRAEETMKKVYTLCQENGMLEGKAKLLSKELTFLNDMFTAYTGSTHELNGDDLETKALLEEDDDEDPMEDQLQADKSRDGEEDGEAQRTRCNEDNNDPESNDEAEELEESYLEETTRRKTGPDPQENEMLEGKAKCLSEGFTLLRDMFKAYTGSTTPNRSTEEFLWEEWQKTKKEIEAGKAKVFGEDDKQNTLATDEVHEATADVNQSSKEVMKYKLTIRKTENGVRVIEGPGNGISWRGKILDKCRCVYHQKFWKICNMKELEEAKKRHCIRCMDGFYQFLNPEDKEVKFKMTIVEHSQDIIRLIWTGEKPDLRDLKHHTSRCIKWIAVENVKHSRKFCVYCRKFCGHDVRGCRKYQRRYGKRPPSPMK